MLTFVLYKCFYGTVINSYMQNILIHKQTPPALSLQSKQYLCLCHTWIHTFIHTHIPIWSNIHTSCRSHTGGVTRRLYVRLRVWKILDIWSMTGPVSGSFIHWVLFSGFSSMSSNAAHKHKARKIFNKAFKMSTITIKSICWLQQKQSFCLHKPYLCKNGTHGNTQCMCIRE